MTNGRISHNDLMSVLVYGILLFLIAFLIHFFVWKIHLPHNHAKVLLSIFLGTLLAGTLIFVKFHKSITFLGIHPPVMIWEYLQLYSLFLSLTAAYVMTYPGIEVDSPSLVMISCISNAGCKGLDRNTLEQLMNDDMLVASRLRDLVDGKMVSWDGNVYKLSKTGLFIAQIFTAYRKLLKKPEKGG